MRFAADFFAAGFFAAGFAAADLPAAFAGEFPPAFFRGLTSRGSSLCKSVNDRADAAELDPAGALSTGAAAPETAAGATIV